MTRPDDTAYADRALALLGGRDPASVLGELESALTSLLEGAKQEDLERPEPPAKWSARQVVGHMLDTELVYGYRLRQTLMADGPEFQRFDQDRWVERFAACAGDGPTCLERLLSLRGWHLEIIRSLSDTELERTSTHSSRGKESVARMVDLWAAHDLMHRRQIQRILDAVGV